jgi:aconitase A
LGVPKTATDAQIKAAFRRLARRYHPDASAGAEATARDPEDERRFKAIARLDGPIEVDYLRQGGILPAVLRRLATD